MDENLWNGFGVLVMNGDTYFEASDNNEPLSRKRLVQFAI
jgi:hypothetical protein